MQNVVETFPRGVEVITGCFIRNEKNELFMAQSPKWGGKWTIPGGHVEPGETILECAQREGVEETGLELKPLKIINFGELIASPDFHRPAHFVWFHCVLDVIGGEVQLQEEELTHYQWFSPEELPQLHTIIDDTTSIANYLKFIEELV